MNITMSDRYELNAAIERLVGDEPGFAVSDAELLIARIPLMGKASPFILDLDSRSQGSSEGYSPGVGNVSLKDGEDKKITLGVPQPARIGGYKLYHRPGRIVIGLMGTEIGINYKDNDHVRLNYSRLTKAPTDMQVVTYRTVEIPIWFGASFIFNLARWNAWKKPTKG